MVIVLHASERLSLGGEKARYIQAPVRFALRKEDSRNLKFRTAEAISWNPQKREAIEKNVEKTKAVAILKNVCFILLSN